MYVKNLINTRSYKNNWFSVYSFLHSNCTFCIKILLANIKAFYLAKELTRFVLTTVRELLKSICTILTPITSILFFVCYLFNKILLGWGTTAFCRWWKWLWMFIRVKWTSGKMWPSFKYIRFISKGNTYGERIEPRSTEWEESTLPAWITAMVSRRIIPTSRERGRKHKSRIRCSQ